MYNLLIADDEAFELIGIKSCINWSAISYNLPYEASNAEQALSALKDKNIDVIIIKIKEPDAWGIDLIHNISVCKTKHPEIIVLYDCGSCAYFRRILSYGVFSILFKQDVVPEKLAMVLSGAADKLDDKMEKAKSLAALEHDRCIVQGNKSPAFWKTELPEQCSIEETLKIYSDIAGLHPFDTQENIRKIFTELRNSKSANLNSVKEVSICIINQLFSGISLHGQIFHDIHSKYPYIYLNVFKLEALDDIERYILDISDYIEHAAKNLRGDVLLAADYIRNNMTDSDITLEKVAEKVNISKNYLSRLFKKFMGKSFTDYLIHLRIERAKELYLTTDFKIYEISEKVGYPNWRYFTKLYKAQTGESITSIKRKLKVSEHDRETKDMN